MLLSHGVSGRPMPVRPGSLTRRQNQTVKMPATHHGTPEAISAPTAAKRCARRLPRLVVTASLRATATLALRSPLRLASFAPQAFTADHFGTRVSRTPAASNR